MRGSPTRYNEARVYLSKISRASAEAISSEEAQFWDECHALTIKVGDVTDTPSLDGEIESAEYNQFLNEVHSA